MGDNGMRDRLRGHTFHERDCEARMSDVALGLNFPWASSSRIESVCPLQPIDQFFKFLLLQDRQHEVTSFAKLPNSGGDKRRPEVAKHSQQSDDEGMYPTTFCSGCGAAMCKSGADRCSRQRKPERLEFFVEYLRNELVEQTEEVPGTKGDSGSACSAGR